MGLPASVVATVTAASATAPVSETATTATKSALPLFFGTGFVDDECTAFEFAAIHFGDGLVGRLVVRKFNEPESLGPAGEFVADHTDGLELTKGLEQLAQLGFGDTVGKTPHIQFFCHVGISLLERSEERRVG